MAANCGFTSRLMAANVQSPGQSMIIYVRGELNRSLLSSEAARDAGWTSGQRRWRGGCLNRCWRRLRPGARAGQPSSRADRRSRSVGHRADGCHCPHLCNRRHDCALVDVRARRDCDLLPVAAAVRGRDSVLYVSAFVSGVGWKRPLWERAPRRQPRRRCPVQ